MKKLFLLFAATVMAMSVMALEPPIATIKGDLQAYDYFCVAPAGGVTASSGDAVVYGIGGVGFVAGSQTNTVNPSDVISGFLMEHGYNVLISPDPEFTNRTLNVIYGYAGRRNVAFGYTSKVIIQMRDVATQELVATFEAEGIGENESEDILQAINRAMKCFWYSRDPHVAVGIYRQNGSFITFDLANHTRYLINNITLKINYFLDEELVHEQMAKINVKLPSGTWIQKDITRDKQVRNKKYKAQAEVVSFE